MALIWISSLIVFLYFLSKFLIIKSKKNLPPGPKGLPIIGQFHLVGKTPHQDLQKLAQKHGPIMYMRFGCIDTVVVSSPAAAELFLKTHDLVFANRPDQVAGNYLSYEQRNIGFAKYGVYWRNMRKLCTMELLSNHKIIQFEPMRKAEIRLFVSSLKQAANGIDLSARIASLSADMTCMMVVGRKFADRDLDEESGFKEVLKEAFEEAGAFNVGDYFPYLRRLDLQGSNRRMKKLSKIFDGFLERIIDDHVNNKHEIKKHDPDFVDTMMEILESREAGFEFDRRHVKAVILDMLVAGNHASANAVEWTFSELIKHPEIMKKLQKELEEVVGLNQIVEESHLSCLNYLDCIIKESMRLHPVGPLLVHESMEDCEVDGFHIPNKSRVLINLWAIGRDPDTWTEPERFYPERFLGSDVDVLGRDFQLIPFGAGRRVCPGLQLGLITIKIIVAQLVHCFDWELPNGMSPSKLDMSEDFGMITSRAKRLMAVPDYRLHIQTQVRIELPFGKLLLSLFFYNLMFYNFLLKLWMSLY